MGENMPIHCQRHPSRKAMRVIAFVSKCSTQIGTPIPAASEFLPCPQQAHVFWSILQEFQLSASSPLL
jgi:hypothetical protein